MKRILLLLSLLLCFTLCGYGQISNATGFQALSCSRPIGDTGTTLNWNSFYLSSVLPHDAVVQHVYAVFVGSNIHDRADEGFFWTAGEYTNSSFGSPSVPDNTTFTNVEYYAVLAVTPDITTGYLWSMKFDMHQSLFQNGLADSETITAVGYAVYYTSATPTTDPQIAAPVSVPAGQGVAWLLPNDASATQGDICGSAVATPSQSTGYKKGLVGGINRPNGTGINGYLRMMLPNGTIKNICVTPNLIVPRLSSSFPIVGGFPQFGNASVVSNDCLYPRVVYNIEVDDTRNNMIYQDNWYLPFSTDFKYNIGELSQTNYGGPITVSVPKGIISAPTQSQVITQPAGTSLALNGTIVINGVTFATAAGGITYTGVLQTNPTTSQTVTQPGGTFLNLVGVIQINGQPFGTGVTSWASRTGAVTPTSGDYSCSQISGSVCTGVNLFYQTIQSNTSNQPTEPALNFSTDFAISDTSSTRTNVALQSQGGVTPGTYSNPRIVVNQQGIITSISSAGAGSQQDILITSGICTTGTASYAQCSMGPFSWPSTYADTNYTTTCSMFNPNTAAVTALFVTNKTNSGFSLILQNGTNSGAHAVTVSEIDCHGSHL